MRSYPSFLVNASVNTFPRQRIHTQENKKFWEEAVAYFPLIRYIYIARKTERSTIILLSFLPPPNNEGKQEISTSQNLLFLFQI
jgi:hypothetical protein